jgi:DNA-binding Xre family transcriptional regulator
MNVVAAGEAARIVQTLKRLMKSRAKTYKQLAQQINLSEVSIKRIFSRSTLSLSRLEQICLALEVSIEEVARISVEQPTDTSEFVTLEQEGELAADPNLLACYYLIANGRTGSEIAVELGVDERQVRRWLVKLHALKLVELRSKFRARARTTSSITWRKDGPMRRLYESQVRGEFLQSAFAATSEALHFRSAELSEESCRVVLRKLERLATEFRDLAELDSTMPARDKRSMAILLAGRPWVFSMFESLRQPTRNSATPPKS